MPLGLVTHFPFWFPNFFGAKGFSSDNLLFMLGLIATVEWVDLFSWFSFYSIMNAVVLATFTAGTVLAFCIRPQRQKIVYITTTEPLVPPGINT